MRGSRQFYGNQGPMFPYFATLLVLRDKRTPGLAGWGNRRSLRRSYNIWNRAQQHQKPENVIVVNLHAFPETQ